MASLKLINKVKYSPWLYNIYYFVGSFVINILGLFVRKDSKLIVFSSYGGRKYDDSPKCIYEQMIHDARFDGYHFIWAFIQPELYSVPRGTVVKTDTFSYYKTLLKASCWITNSTMERGLRIKKRSVFYFNTWHGTPIKLMGTDIDVSNKSFGAKKNKECPYDAFLAQSEYDAEIFRRSFDIPNKVMKIIGLPRNDELLNNCSKERVVAIKEKLGIPIDKIIILYAPTFREFSKDDDSNCVIAPPIHLEKWEEKIGRECLLLFRAHYEVVKVMNITENGFVKNVSLYPDLNELMMITDILISDYSSIFFDFSITHRPMICFAYDYEEYTRNRGMYFDIREWLPVAENEDKLLFELFNLNKQVMNSATLKFQQHFVTEYGHATERSVELIYQGIQEINKA